LSEIVDPQIECAEISDKYGRFITEPLERGSGITLGNAMRRTLLSSLPGTAITWVSIEGVQHEFSTIPHVKEDTIEFLLNVKQIRIRPLSSAGGKLNLRAEGEVNVLAGDIEPSAEFEVVNPDLHLATLDFPEAKLIVEFNVEQGKGYRPSIQGYRPVGYGDGLPLGVLSLDAIFTPVRKVNYNIETINIGQSSYERLVLDVWTDGTISAVEALSRSAQLLIEQFQPYYELDKVPLRVGEKQPRLPIPLEQYNMPIEELGLSVRTSNCLKRSGITKTGELFEKSEQELLNINNFGKKTLEELMGQLREKGLLSEDSEEVKWGKAEGEAVNDTAMQDEPAEDF